MELYLETFDVAELVRGRRRHRSSRWSRRTATRCEVDCPDDLGAMHADLTKVRQALFNLLSNAGKFTERRHDHARGRARAGRRRRRLDRLPRRATPASA